MSRAMIYVKELLSRGINRKDQGQYQTHRLHRTEENVE